MLLFSVIGGKGEIEDGTGADNVASPGMVCKVCTVQEHLVQVKERSLEYCPSIPHPCIWPGTTSLSNCHKDTMWTNHSPEMNLTLNLLHVKCL